jgi:hypothetical protein
MSPMTAWIRSAPWLGILIALAAAAGPARAQPAPVGAVTPPARADVALRGRVLATLQVSGYPACQAECKRIGGCTGYNHATGSLRPPPALPGMPPAPPASNCTLLTGDLADAPQLGVISCRMPCGAQGKAGTVASPVAGRTPQAAGNSGPSTLRPLPGASAAATPPAIAVPVVPPLVSGGTYVPAPAPAPASAPPAAPRAGIGGYEIVSGPEINLAPLASATASAQCPVGKVALSAGYQVHAGGDASFGLEVRGALPEGREARVLVRNANVLEPARARALAVCVNAIAGLRSVDSEVFSGSQSAGDARLACAAGERVVGGGAMGTLNGLLGINAPQGGSTDTAWQVRQISSTAAPAVRVSATVRALCAPEPQVDGWELVQSAAQSLGAHSKVTLAQGCPVGKVLLAAGLVQTSSNLLDMVSNTLEPGSNTLNWTAQVHNRNTINGSGNVVVSLAAVCARRT